MILFVVVAVVVVVELNYFGYVSKMEIKLLFTVLRNSNAAVQSLYCTLTENMRYPSSVSNYIL